MHFDAKHLTSLESIRYAVDCLRHLSKSRPLSQFACQPLPEAQAMEETTAAAAREVAVTAEGAQLQNPSSD